MGNKELNIFPGSYYISDKVKTDFLKAYCKKVFGKNPQQEYLTESQDKVNGGPILIDIDFRLNSEITERQFKITHITDFIELYSEKISQLFDVNNSYPIFVFEKPNIQILEKNDTKVVKDGLHIIIGLHLEHNKQLLLRKHVLKDIDDVIGDLELLNSNEDVIDEAITSGRNNWLMYGSSKPGGQTYKLKHTFEISFDEDGFPTQQIINKYDEISDKKKVKLFSTRKTWEKIELKESFIKELESISNPSNNKSSNVVFNSTNKIIFSEEQAYYIDSIEKLEQQLNALHDSLEPSEYYIKETYDYVMALPEKYYTDYNKWIEVGFALKNTSKMLIYAFITALLLA